MRISDWSSDVCSSDLAIAVPDLAAAAATYANTLGAKVSAPLAQPEHGVTVVFVELPNTKLDLLHPLGEGSPIAKFLAHTPAGGMPPVCYEIGRPSCRDRGCQYVEISLGAVS